MNAGEVGDFHVMFYISDIILRAAYSLVSKTIPCLRELTV